MYLEAHIPTTGIPAIDCDHIRLMLILSTIENTHRYTSIGDRRSFDADHFAAFCETLRQHCAYEDTLMSRTRYPRYGVHRTQHRELLQCLSSVYATPRCFSGPMLARSLRSMVIAHIEESDVPFSNWMRSSVDTAWESCRHTSPSEVDKRRHSSTPADDLFMEHIEASTHLHPALIRSAV